jgi:glycosyltransferase involved in cell wall biosynthesis
VNILMLTAYPPVLHLHGGGVRMYHNIRLLSQSHSVRVITFVENEEERALLRSLDGICESVTAVRRIPDFRPHWLSLDPFLVREFSSLQMEEAIAAAFQTKKVDALQCEYLQMAQYRRRGTFGILTILETLSANARDAFERETEPVAKFKLYYRWMQMLRYEVWATRRFDRVVTMTEHDAAYLRSYSPGADIRAIPIGIDTTEFYPLPEEPERPLEVLFVGNFRHTPNVEAANFLVKEIAPAFPSIRFVLLGSNVPREIGSGPNIVLPGYVSDTRTLYHRPGTIVAAPLFSGTGQRVKLLEAFSMGCPVITSTIGALGFPIRTGVEAIVADSADSFRDAVARLSACEELRRNLGRSGREMVMRVFDWTKIGIGFHEILPRL